MLFKHGLRKLEYDAAAALFGWAATALICIILMVAERSSIGILVLTSIGFLLFAAFLIVVASTEGTATRKEYVLLALEYIVVCALYFAIPYDYIAILMVIWSAQMAWFIPFRQALVLSILWSSPLWLVGEFYWQKDQAWVSAILFWSFNVFGIFMITMTRNEQEAREEIEHKRRELESTQHLLGEAAAQLERTRIARDIHDVIGHQLTALIMNLQAANRGLKGNEGATPEFVSKASQIAKHLLEDIRTTVSEIRNEDAINLLSAIKVLTKNLPNVQFELNLNDIEKIEDVAIAETVLRFIQETISNAMRHGRASLIIINAFKQGAEIVVEVIDNGIGFNPNNSHGNGLRGLVERASLRNGDVKLLSQKGKGTQAVLNIPL